MTLDDLAQETEFKFIVRLQDAKTRAEDLARHSRAQSGLEIGDGSNHQALLDNTEQVSTAQQKKNSRSKDNTLWLDLVQRQIEELNAFIIDAEKGFSQDFGEDWREQFALKILDPDLVPQRLDGESIAEYRARVEQALMDELLNDDGSIKDEYKDHPEYGQLAQWAQWKHDQQHAMTLQARLSNPAISDAEREKVMDQFTQTATYQRLNQESLSETEVGADLLKVKEAMKDDKLNVSPENSETSFAP